MNPCWADNALWPGEAIVQRLAGEVPALAEVLCIDQFDPKATEPRNLPAAVVLLSALRIKGSNAQRSEASIEQDWLVVLAVRSAARDPGKDSAEFGPLIPPVVAALLNWKPAGGLRGFEWKTGPRPIYDKDISYFPLLFTLQLVAGPVPA